MMRPYDPIEWVHLEYLRVLEKNENIQNSMVFLINLYDI